MLGCEEKVIDERRQIVTTVLPDKIRDISNGHDGVVLSVYDDRGIDVKHREAPFQ